MYLSSSKIRINKIDKNNFVFLSRGLIGISKCKELGVKTPSVFEFFTLQKLRQCICELKQDRVIDLIFAV